MPSKRWRLERSNECASRLKHALNTGVHLILFDKFTALRRSYACFNSRKKLSLVVEVADENLFHELFRVGPGFYRDFHKLRFLLGRKMDFHRIQNTGTQHSRQSPQNRQKVQSAILLP